jgi:hypothetical protein
MKERVLALQALEVERDADAEARLRAVIGVKLHRHFCSSQISKPYTVAHSPQSLLHGTWPAPARMVKEFKKDF